MAFDLGSSRTNISQDQRQWFDSYNVTASPTAALSDVGKVAVNIAPPQRDNPALAALAAQLAQANEGYVNTSKLLEAANVKLAAVTAPAAPALDASQPVVATHDETGEAHGVIPVTLPIL